MCQTDVIIIGGGIIGLAIAYKLSRKYEVFLFEKNDFLGHETSTRNSCVIHSGIYYKKNSLKSNFCKKGNQMMYEFCKKNGIETKEIGKLIVSDEKDKDKLFELYKKGRDNGVELEIITESFIKKKEPSLEAEIAIFVKSAGIVDIGGLIKKLEALAKNNDAKIILKTKVNSIIKKKDSFLITTNRGDLESRILINAAGLYSDEIANIIEPKKYRIIPVRGEYYEISSRIYKVKHLVYPLPNKTDLGIHLTPTFSDTILVGPNYVPINKKEDYENNRRPAEEFYESIKKFLPNLKLEDLKQGYTGIRPKTESEDFIIENNDNMINLIGIDSPGLTCCLAIAEYVENIIK